MRLILAASLLLSTFAFTGCGGGGSSSSLAGATPQATFDAMKGAAAKKDWGGMISCMSADSQDMMIGGMSMMVQMMSAFGGGDKMKGASDILTKHGVKMEMPTDPAAAANPQDAMKKATAGVKDKTACLSELMVWFEKNGDEKQKANFNPDEMASAVLADVKIDGDTATGKVTTKKGGEEKTDDAHFKKVDGKWYMDLTADMKKGM